jgi:hypothetical protein
MRQSCQPSDIELLRAAFPSWSIAAVWTAVASGPDKRRLVAIRGEQVLSAWDADSLAAMVTAESIAAALRDEEQPQRARH